jgi:hypothetical protein
LVAQVAQLRDSKLASFPVSDTVAMITYGWTFYSGFMNFYLSLGLGFFAVVLFWRGARADWLVAAVLALLALLAHPLGFLCLIGLGAYFRLADLLHGWRRWV